MPPKKYILKEDQTLTENQKDKEAFSSIKDKHKDNDTIRQSSNPVYNEKNEITHNSGYHEIVPTNLLLIILAKLYKQWIAINNSMGNSKPEDETVKKEKWVKNHATILNKLNKLGNNLSSVALAKIFDEALDDLNTEQLETYYQIFDSFRTDTARTVLSAKENQAGGHSGSDTSQSNQANAHDIVRKQIIELVVDPELRTLNEKNNTLHKIVNMIILGGITCTSIAPGETASTNAKISSLKDQKFREEYEQARQECKNRIFAIIDLHEEVKKHKNVINKYTKNLLKDINQPLSNTNNPLHRKQDESDNDIPMPVTPRRHIIANPNGVEEGAYSPPTDNIRTTPTIPPPDNIMHYGFYITQPFRGKRNPTSEVLEETTQQVQEKVKAVKAKAVAEKELAELQKDVLKTPQEFDLVEQKFDLAERKLDLAEQQLSMLQATENLVAEHNKYKEALKNLNEKQKAILEAASSPRKMPKAHSEAEQSKVKAQILKQQVATAEQEFAAAKQAFAAVKQEFKLAFAAAKQEFTEAAQELAAAKQELSEDQYNDFETIANKLKAAIAEAIKSAAASDLSRLPQGPIKRASPTIDLEEESDPNITN